MSTYKYGIYAWCVQEGHVVEYEEAPAAARHVSPNRVVLEGLFEEHLRLAVLNCSEMMGLNIESGTPIPKGQKHKLNSSKEPCDSIGDTCSSLYLNPPYRLTYKIE